MNKPESVSVTTPTMISGFTKSIKQIGMVGYYFWAIGTDGNVWIAATNLNLHINNANISSVSINGITKIDCSIPWTSAFAFNNIGALYGIHEYSDLIEGCSGVADDFPNLVKDRLGHYHYASMNYIDEANRKYIDPGQYQMMYTPFDMAYGFPLAIRTPQGPL